MRQAVIEHEIMRPVGEADAIGNTIDLAAVHFQVTGPIHPDSVALPAVNVKVVEADVIMGDDDTVVARGHAGAFDRGDLAWICQKGYIVAAAAVARGLHAFIICAASDVYPIPRLHDICRVLDGLPGSAQCPGIAVVAAGSDIIGVAGDNHRGRGR